MRGMDHKESAQKTIDAFRIHYNFVREHIVQLTKHQQSKQELI